MRPGRVATESNGRFSAGLIGAVGASLVWLAVVIAMAITPEGARERRSAPEVPPPTAALTRSVLREIAWYDCSPDRAAVEVTTPQPPPGFRSVVTWMIDAGADVSTGTVLARVADQPLIAVATSAAFYRDLVVGDHGPDVRAFETALHDRGLIPRPDASLDADAVAAWQRQSDPDGPPGRVRLATLVPVPPHSAVDVVVSSVGERVQPGAALLSVAAKSNTFGCDVPDPPARITPKNVVFEVDGKPSAVRSVSARQRGHDQPGQVEVLPVRQISAERARLGIEASHSAGSVLVAPLSAIRASADGAQIVVVVEGSTRREVRVSLGATAQGLVAVEGAGLEPGAQVELFSPPKRE